MAQTTTEALAPIPSADLTQVTGGVADPEQVGGQIGSLVDSFTGGNGEGAQLGAGIGKLVKPLLG